MFGIPLHVYALRQETRKSNAELQHRVLSTRAIDGSLNRLADLNRFHQNASEDQCLWRLQKNPRPQFQKTTVQDFFDLEPRAELVNPFLGRALMNFTALGSSVGLRTFQDLRLRNLRVRNGVSACSI